jgi:dUTP pyrophosphatase
MKMGFPFKEIEVSPVDIRIPYSKAIAQCAVELIPDVEVVEVSADEIKSLKTERGEGKLGSSGK